MSSVQRRTTRCTGKSRVRRRSSLRTSCLSLGPDRLEHEEVGCPSVTMTRTMRWLDQASSRASGKMCARTCLRRSARGVVPRGPFALSRPSSARSCAIGEPPSASMRRKSTPSRSASEALAGFRSTNSQGVPNCRFQRACMEAISTISSQRVQPQTRPMPSTMWPSGSAVEPELSRRNTRKAMLESWSQSMRARPAGTPQRCSHSVPGRGRKRGREPRRV
mmetsp:Transcript_24378/g.66508  ORF Transcript_24378/g.66508 Transcript_24378/m.66508 type:complete len:220 (+) Transcript_24378:471-1130(+)